MSYKVFLSRKSNSFLNKLDKKDSNRIKEKLKELTENPELGKPLIGRLSGLCTLRIGDYRAIYQIRKSELLVLALKIGHRKDVYG